MIFIRKHPKNHVTVSISQIAADRGILSAKYRVEKANGKAPYIAEAGRLRDAAQGEIHLREVLWLTLADKVAYEKAYRAGIRTRDKMDKLRGA